MKTPAPQARPYVVTLASMDVFGDSLARVGRELAAAYAVTPLAKRRDAKARLVAVVNAYALVPSLAEVANQYFPARRALSRDLVPRPASRSALATCHASNAPSSFRVATIARGPNPSP